MFDHRHYVPILKGKMGEFGALRTLSPPTKARLTPVIDVPPRPWDYPRSAPRGTLAGHLERVISKYLVRCWEPALPLFLDLTYCAGEGELVGGAHPLTYALNLAMEKGFSPIPTTSLDANPGYQRAIEESHLKPGIGLCIRINRDDFIDLDDLATKLLVFVRAVKANPNTTDLIIDLRACRPEDVVQRTSDAKAVLAALPMLRRWRTLTLAGTGFPPSLPNPPNSEDRLPRTELEIWRGVITASRKLGRIPAFGDYGIEGPDHKEVDPRTMRMSSNLRYTTDRDWLVMKGSWVGSMGGVRFPDLCRSLVRRREYRKAGFSWGDEYISLCARGDVGPGNATTWRQVGTSHHITLVAAQVSSGFAA